MYREIGDRQNEAVNLNNIGWFYFEKGDYEDAVAYSQQALEIKQKVGSPADIAETLYNLGEIFSRTGLYSQGVDYYLKALDLWRKAGDKRGVAFVNRLLLTDSAERFVSALDPKSPNFGYAWYAGI